MSRIKCAFLFRYFLQRETVYALVIILTFPFVSSYRTVLVQDGSTLHVHAYQYHIAAIGIICTWFVNMIHIADSPVLGLGLYLQMLVKVSFNFIKFFFVCISLLIAFACSFTILFPREDSMKTSLLSIIKEHLNSHITIYS